MKLFVILLVVASLNSALANGPKCMDQDFVGAFAQAQRCWLGNDAFSCGFPDMMSGLVGGGVGILAFEGVYNSRARRLPVSLDEKELEKYFKKVPHAQELQAEIDQIKSNIPNASAESKAILKQRLDWLEWKKRYLAVDVASEELTDETTKSLKKKGYKVDEIDKVRKALADYQRELREYQNKMDEAEALDHHEKQRLEKEVALAEDGLRNQPDNQKAQKRASEARENLKTFKHATIPLVEMHKMTEGAALARAREKITALRQQMSITERGIVKGTLGGAALGLGVGLAPFVIDEVALQKCKSQIGFKSDSDIGNFRKFGKVAFSKCGTEVAPDKIWDLLLLDPNERNKIFSDSPALCRAFENTFSRMMTDMKNKAPEINFDRTECGNGTISTVVKVGDHVYPQTFDLSNGTISMKASFITDVDFSDLKDFEKFTLTLKRDQDWTGVSTNNPTWGSIPGVRENFESVAKAADPVQFRDFNCESLSALKGFERKMVNHPSSSPKLMCAVHEQAIAAKTALPYLLKFCGKKSEQNSKIFNQVPEKSLQGVR